MPRALLCAAALVLPAFGCESTTPDVEDTALVTDGTSFRLDTATSPSGHLLYHGQIPYSFTNRTGSKVYIPANCDRKFSIGLQWQTDGEWEGILGQVFRTCGGPPIEIEPDEVYRTTLDVRACLVGNCVPKIRLSPTPTTPHRIVWYEALSSYDPDEDPHGELIPLKDRISNTFTLQVPR